MAIQQQDTTKTPAADTLRYPIRDRRTDPFTERNRNPFDLRDPSNIERKIEYDPTTRQYYIYEKIGNRYYRNPTALSYEEFLRVQAAIDEENYFRERASTLSNLNRKLLRPELTLKESFFNRLFGNGKIDIRPQGYVDIMAGYQGQNIKNPTLPEQARKNGGFDFDLNANINVTGNIGDKLKLPISYNTQSTFDFENQLKLDYTGLDDEIVKRFEAGNVNFSSKGTLIPGAQSLFGVKTTLQFGKLFVTGVLANQRSQISSQSLQGGAATQSFQIKAHEYEENRHFLLAQYFRNNYNKAMANLPVVASQVQILRMEVWVTNRNGSTTDTRDVVAFMDLGESSPYNSGIASLSSNPLPDNNANDLYGRLARDPSARNPALIQSRLSAMGMRPVEDFEKTFARKLSPDEYYYNPQIGFLSLNQQLREDEVLGVAFQYQYNGRVITVGEFSQDVPPDTANALPGTQKVLFLKLLKATSQRTYLPLWDLMMKNVYSVGTYNLQRDDFKLNILYQEPSLGEKRFLPEGDQAGVPLLTLLNLDRLNNQNDPQSDGVFDYVEGFTVLTRYSRIIFPLLEPFGRDLDSIAFRNSPQELKDKYVYYPLYDTIKSIAETYANLNRYVMQGTARSSGGDNSEISLNAYNVPKGSVTITAGGQLLKEDIDYVIDYNLGTVKILNQSILNANIPVNVQYENNAAFGLQQRNFMGLRLDYLANDKLSVGGTIVRLSERPFFTKTLYNEDPIRNTMYGLDFNYRSDIPRMKQWLSKLPNYEAKAPVNLNVYGEAAMLKPGHPPQIGKGNAGLSYIDDFEGTRNSIDLRFPLIGWALASTPQGNGLFPEADLVNDLRNGQNRARISWYNIEPTLQDRRAPNNPINDVDELSKPETRSVTSQEIFPLRTPDLGQNQLVTFDLAYFPTERGPYNFDTRPGWVNGDGKLLNPRNRWGGIMRAIDQIDFETGNVEYIEFWVQDPYILKPFATGGKFYINLGNISEDILRDSRRQFENGLNTPKIPSPSDTTTRWGKVPANPIQVTNAFSNDPADREYQDVGLDGLSDQAEREKFADYLNELRNTFGESSAIYQQAFADPANDNFRNYRDAEYDKLRTGILGRYSRINMPQGNSPIASAGDQQTTAFTLYPDQEDLNRDNTLNELEEYFEYEVDIRPNMSVGSNFITDKRIVDVRLANGTTRSEAWYQFRIPISEYARKVGNIPDFKSIRFVRMFLTGFEDTVVLRFAKLDLVRNQWRQFAYKLDTAGRYIEIDRNSPTTMNTLAVNIEENDRRVPVPYRIPPGIERMQQISNNNVNILQNEQALSLQICGLQEGDARGVFKTMNLDLRQYGRISMFTHAESVIGQVPLQDNSIYAVVRFGTDFISNYYEVKIPLRITRPGESLDTLVWPTQNNLDFDLSLLTKLKVERNNNGSPLQYYSKQIDGKIFAIYGNPNLGEIRGMFIGVENPDDDGSPVCTEVWFNELRLSSINEKGGYAALGRLDLLLSDLGNISVAGNYRSSGFGAIDERVNQRSREDFSQIDFALNIDAGKVLPEKAGISIPVYASVSKTLSTPEYDPYDKDILLHDKLEAASSKRVKDSIRNDAIDVTTIKTINFTNVRKNNTSGKPLKIWSVENLDFTYSYTKTERHNPLIESDEVVRHRGGLGYNFSAQPKYWEPFKKVIRSNSPWLSLFKGFNLNPSPSLLGFRADINRQFGAIRPRNVGGGPYRIPETYDKFFTFDRIYNLRWDLSRSLNLDFSATNNARVDEPYGRIDTKPKKDSVKHNFWKGGRNTLYRQAARLTYNVPLSKIPALDWTTMNATYGAGYNWIGASRLAVDLGNIIENSLQRNAQAELDFEALYRKSKLLASLDRPVLPRSKNNPKDTTATRGRGARTASAEESAKELTGFARGLAKVLTSVKRMSITYDETYSTRLPGYMDSTELLGQNWVTMSPGLDFIFGRQPDTAFINRFAAKGLLTRDPEFNLMIQQNFNQQLTINTKVQPVNDLTIDLNLTKAFNKGYSELYKDTTGSSGFSRLSPYTTGGFSISYISFQTLFSKFEANSISETFREFENNRLILSQRLGKMNPYSAGPGADGYYEGYGKYAQDVLIPSFLAAYTGKNPEQVALIDQSNPNIKSNPFRKILPKPNWAITYNGLTRIKAFEKVFTSFTIRHAYNSMLSMNSYTSALLYADPFSIGYPAFIDTVSGNFVPYFLVPNITIDERFEPFLDLDMQFTNQFSTHLEYKKSRMLSLSLIDYQLSENRSTEYVIGIGWRKRGFPLPFRIKLPGKEASNRLDNDINFRLDFSWRDDATANSRLDLNSALPTSGQRVITISPSIDYVLNNRVNLKLFFDQRRTEPKVSTSAPITTTRAGLQIRVALAQ